MSNTKALTPGTYCKPKDEKEWRAVLDLADSLGLGGILEDRERMIYTLVGLISDGFVRGVHSDAVHDVVFWTNPIPLPDFIAGMYALAEERMAERKPPVEADTKEEVGRLFAFVGGRWVDVSRELLPQIERHEQRIKALEERNRVATAKCGCPSDGYISEPVHPIEPTPLQRQVTELYGRIKALESTTDLLRKDDDAIDGVCIGLDKRVAELEQERDKWHFLRDKEEQRLTKLEQALNDHMVKERCLSIVDQAIYDNMVKEREKSEKEDKFMNDVANKPVLSPDAINAQIDRICRVKSVSSSDDHDLRIDPNASPKDIPFSVALEYLKLGREIARPHWCTPARRRVQPHGIGGVGGLRVITGASYDEGPFHPDTAEMVANDWLVIPEDPK